MANAKSGYAVIYRTGGADNGRWHRVLGVYATWESAQAMAAGLERQGYPALVHDVAQLDSIGMPDDSRMMED